MDQPVTATRHTSFRALAILAATIAGGAIGWLAWEAIPTSAPPVQTAAPSAPAAELSNTSAAAASDAVKPSFDIVRVSPDGGLVVAGQAEPKSTITVKRGDAVVAEVTADARGAWVAVPPGRLEPGSGELTLASRNGAGEVRNAETTAVIVVPSPPGTASSRAPQPSAAPPLAVLTTPAAPSRLLQAPGSTPAGKLGLATVDYDDAGAIHFSGTAPPATTVRVYVDNSAVGDASADVHGEWRLSPDRAVSPGLHRLRVDEIDSSGRVAGRLEVPFARESLALSQVAPGKVVVQPGQNLWRLARRVYGTGLRYTVIYAANRDQIRDIKRIYPGQVFSVPSLAH